MLSLVTYDNSSDSENEANDTPDANVKINSVHQSFRSVTTTKSRINGNVISSGSSAAGDLFTSLPKPELRNAEAIQEEQDEFLQKKEQALEKPQKRIRIGVPALNQFDSDEDEPSEKKSKQAQKASGLFSLLPAPKGTPLSNTSFVPNILQRKAGKSVPTKPAKAQPKNSAPVVTTADTQDNSDSTDDDIDVPEIFDDETWQKVCGRKKRPAPSAAQEEVPVLYHEPACTVESAPDVSKPYDGLDNQAFKELVGSRKRVKENIKLIDIHEDEIRPDKVDWLKSLTDPNFEPETAIEEPVNNTCKVKNHITALAQKALANDKELQMRWAENRHNRKQTQAKYGF